MEKHITTIGNKIRIIRELKGISKEQMSQQSGLDLDYISKIEDENQIPAIGELIKIVRVLGVRLGTILDDQSHDGPVISRAEDINSDPVSRFLQRPNNCLSYHCLSSKKSDRHMETYHVRLQANNGQKEFSSHEGEEFIYVLEGEIEVIYGKETYKLKTGDSIYYDSIVDHYIGSASATAPAKVLAVIYVPL